MFGPIIGPDPLAVLVILGKISPREADQAWARLSGREAPTTPSGMAAQLQEVLAEVKMDGIQSK